MNTEKKRIFVNFKHLFTNSTNQITEAKIKLDDLLKEDTTKFADAIHMYLIQFENSPTLG